MSVMNKATVIQKNRFVHTLLVAVAGIEDLIRNRRASRDRNARRAEAMLVAIREAHS